MLCCELGELKVWVGLVNVKNSHHFLACHETFGIVRSLLTIIILLIELRFSTEIHFTTGLLLKNLDIVDQEW